MNIDNGVGGINNDKVIKHDTWTKIKGGLDGANEPFYDEIEFNGSLDDSDWEIVNADPEIRVTVDGTVKQEG
ncbi:hypothetical protein C455_07877 [Haloferax larsenii JCM 13917]|nr:hypothetical protein C455_07877 [Haloferax larsenii JCM 13917]